MANNISESREMAKKLFENLENIDGVFGYGVSKSRSGGRDGIRILVDHKKRLELGTQIPSWYLGHPVVLEEYEPPIFYNGPDSEG